MISALYIDDCNPLLGIVSRFLTRNGDMTVETAMSLQDGGEMVRNHRYGVVIMDYNLKDSKGLEFFRQLRGEGITIPVIIFTLDACREIEDGLLEPGRVWFVRKCSGTVSGVGELDRIIRQEICSP
ncbi:MAG: response regulator [Methanoregula sp.]|nr:response regulator [Methanoregula sp.]